MNRMFVVIVLASLALSAAAEVIPGEPIREAAFKNMVADPGGERLVGKPATDHWSYYNVAEKWVVDKTVFHTGKQSVRIDMTQDKTYGGYVSTAGADNVPVIEFGGWAKVKATTGKPARPRFYLQVYLKNGKVLENTATFQKAPVDWQFTGNRVVLGNVQIKYVLLYCLAEHQVGAAWFDDVYVGFGKKALKKGANLLATGGFEDISSWRPYGEGFVADAKTVRSGKGSLQLKAETPYRLYGARCIIRPDGPMDGVVIGGWCRSVRKGGRAAITADIHYKDGSVLPGLSAVFPTAAHDWLNREKELVIINKEIDYIVVSAELLFAGSGEVWFDDLSLCPLRP